MKEKIKGMFLHSLGNRLFLYFTLLMAVPLTLVGFSVYAISVAHISDMALQSSTQIVEKVSGDMDSLLTDMVYISRLVDNDKFIEQATQQNAAFSSEQAVQTIEDRLRAILAWRIGTDVELNTTIDPSVIGGVKVSVRDLVMDSTVRSTVAGLRVRLTG